MNVWTITDGKMEEETARYIIENAGDWNIDMIRDLTETEAQIMAEKHEVIKGHDVYFINFEGYFGYSYVVFLRGHHIRYAGDYELHHKGKTREELDKWYRRCLSKKLYTERQLGNKLRNYGDYQNRRYYLHNYYGDTENHVSIFGDGSNKEFVAEYKRVTEKLFYSDVTFAYYESAEFVEKLKDLEAKIEAAKDAMNNDFDYWKKAFRYEFANYECIYGGRYTEAAYAATNGKSLNDIQKRAFKEAKREYERYCYDHDMP